MYPLRYSFPSASLQRNSFVIVRVAEQTMYPAANGLPSFSDKSDEGLQYRHVDGKQTFLQARGRFRTDVFEAQSCKQSYNRILDIRTEPSAYRRPRRLRIVLRIREQAHDGTAQGGEDFADGRTHDLAEPTAHGLPIRFRIGLRPKEQADDVRGKGGELRLRGVGDIRTEPSAYRRPRILNVILRVLEQITYIHVHTREHADDLVDERLKPRRERSPSVFQFRVQRTETRNQTFYDVST